MSTDRITELSVEQIENMDEHGLRALVRDVDLPLEELGQVGSKLDQLDRPTLVRLVYHIRRQYQQRNGRD